jgi:hypothetical protein
MSDAPQAKGQTPAESGAMICAIGFVVSIGVLLMDFVRDVSDHGLWGWSRLGTGILLWGCPLLFGLAICGYFLRRERDKPNS